MKYVLTYLLVLSFVVIAGNEKGSRSNTPSLNEKTTPVTNLAVTFEERFNANNTPDGIATRGWLFVNVDNGGTSTCFSGNTTVFTAYEGPDSGYIAQNYQGANSFYINQWLISPPVTVFAQDTLSFWYRTTTPGTTVWPDSVGVYLSPTAGTTPASFTTTLKAKTQVPPTWTNIKAVFPANGTVRFAFQYLVYDGGANGNSSDYWGLDLVQIIAGPNVPVELASFNASVSLNDVSFMWQTATETNNKGFEIERKGKDGKYTSVGFVDGKGTTTIAQLYSFVDKGVVAGKYTYRLKQVDFDGTSEVLKSVEVEVVNPMNYSLEQNYPNPFNPSTNVSFTLAADSKVSLKVFNVLGQEVATLVNATMTAGQHTVQFNAKNLQSGVYFAKIEANGVDGKNFSSVKKMILNK